MNNVNSLRCNALNLASKIHTPNQKTISYRSISFSRNNPSKKAEIMMILSYFRDLTKISLLAFIF